MHRRWHDLCVCHNVCVAEPIAAALAYGYGVGGPASSSYDTLLVFDLGGGTLDVSLLEGWDGILEVRNQSVRHRMQTLACEVVLKQLDWWLWAQQRGSAHWHVGM